MSVPKYIELTLSDEDKTSLVEKCVNILLNGRQGNDEQSSVSICLTLVLKLEVCVCVWNVYEVAFLFFVSQ